MEQLQAWLLTWLDPHLLGELALERIKRSLDKYGLSIPAAHRAVPPAQLIASK